MSHSAPKSVHRTGISALAQIERVGRTPLLRLDALIEDLPHVTLLGKAEWCNPGGSVKDRAALRMIVEAERTGRLRPGMTIIDATSGNTGIAYAWIGAIKGYPVEVVVPDNASSERKRILSAHGARVIYTDPLEGMDGAIARAEALFRSAPARYFYPDQYCNPANWRAHYDGTALEIWQQTAGTVTHFVAGLGTSGTFVGTSRRLKTLNPGVYCASVEPDGPFHGLEGLKYMDGARVPGIYAPELADRRMFVRTEDAYAMVRRLARRHGMLVGPSSGAAIAASIELARDIPPDSPATIVTILCDGGERYLRERFWEVTDR